jgi:hypothetical protein
VEGQLTVGNTLHGVLDVPPSLSGRLPLALGRLHEGRSALSLAPRSLNQAAVHNTCTQVGGSFLATIGMGLASQDTRFLQNNYSVETGKVGDFSAATGSFVSKFSDRLLDPMWRFGV